MLKSVKYFEIGRNSGVILFQPSGSPFECSNLKILVAPSLPTSSTIPIQEIVSGFLFSAVKTRFDKHEN